jgi:hypothetical protein
LNGKLESWLSRRTEDHYLKGHYGCRWTFFLTTARDADPQLDVAAVYLEVVQKNYGKATLGSRHGRVDVGMQIDSRATNVSKTEQSSGL